MKKQRWNLQEGMLIQRNGSDRILEVTKIRVNVESDVHNQPVLDINCDLCCINTTEVFEFIPISPNFFERYSPVQDQSEFDRVG